MADETMGRQVINISDTVSNTVKNLGQELSGNNLEEKRDKMILDHVFCFTGLAGGVGTSTVVANIAYLLKKMHYSVLVVDTNILYPIQHTFFKIKQEIETTDFFSFLYGDATLGESIKYPMGSDLGVLIANNRTLENTIDAETREAGIAFYECLDRVGSLFDFILIDCGNNLLSELTNSALYKADRIIAVMDENIECLSNYSRMTSAMACSGIDYTRVKTIMNKRTSIQYSKSIFNDFGIELLAVLPFDLGVMESGLRGEIFCQKGASMSKNAALFVQRMNQIATSMKRLSGETRADEEV